VSRCHFRLNPFGLVDPKSEFKRVQGGGEVETVLKEERVHQLASLAEVVLTRYQKEI
jgi:hypothetical protein